MTLTFDLWPFAWTSLLSLVITHENFMMIRLQGHCEKVVTDRWTDRSVLRAWSQLKIDRVKLVLPHQISAQSDQWFVYKYAEIWKTRQIWGIWKLQPAYSPETPNLGQNRWCFVPCDLEIWWMTLGNNRASLLCCVKLCATFHSRRWIQTGVTVRKRPIWVKFDDF